MDDLVALRGLLHAELGWEVDTLDEVGTGAWSTAYRFDGDGRDLVVRVGAHVEDFHADEVAAAHRSDALPIPEVLHVGPFGTGHVCVSTFAPGTPLESCSSSEWAAVIPSLADAMVAMRECRPSRRVRPWNALLLAVDGDHAGTRLAGWRDAITRAPDAVVALESLMSRLRSIDAQVALGDVEATLTHGDLINRNVHVDGGAISGVFDWGCMRWGDHLYDLAWFDFWAPWYPELDMAALRDELDRRWSGQGQVIGHRAERERACLLHIGAEHLIYNAVIDSPDGLVELLERLGGLDLI